MTKRLSGGPLLVFDIGNVLLRFDIARAARNFEKCEPGKGKDLARAIWFSKPAVHMETGRLSGVEMYRHLKKRYRLKMSYARLRRAFTDIFTPLRENLLLFKFLSRRCPVALLSNTNPIHWKYIFQKYPVLGRARWKYSSHRLGFLKPDPRIFRALARRTGFPLRAMILVDDLSENIRSARRLGMTALHFHAGRSMKKELSRLAGFSRNGNTRA